MRLGLLLGFADFAAQLLALVAVERFEIGVPGWRQLDAGGVVDGGLIASQAMGCGRVGKNFTRRRVVADVVERDGLELAIPEIVQQRKNGGKGLGLDPGIDQRIEIVAGGVAGGFEEAGGGEFHGEDGEQLLASGDGDET